MVFLQAAARRDSVAAACLEFAENGHIQLCLSEAILSEISDVLNRDEIRTRFPALNENLVREFVAALRGFASVYEAVGEHFSYPRDPKDEPYLNLAIEANATHLVSRDNDILDLARGADPVAASFRKRYPKIHILEPLDFLRAIRTQLGS